jgi:hypothetical protein
MYNMMAQVEGVLRKPDESSFPMDSRVRLTDRGWAIDGVALRGVHGVEEPSLVQPNGVLGAPTGRGVSREHIFESEKHATSRQGFDERSRDARESRTGPQHPAGCRSNSAAGPRGGECLESA